MSITFYKFIHLLGVLGAFFALGGALFGSLQVSSKEKLSGRKIIGAFHGISLVLALVGGFGLMARMQLKFSQNGWLWGKLIIWLVVGALLAFIYKSPQSSKTKWIPAVLAVALIALWLVELKPFSSF